MPAHDPLAVPFKMLMSPKAAGHSAVGAAFKEIALPSSIIMTLWLIHEKNDAASFWKPWLDVLPDTVPSSLNFDEAELAEMEGAHKKSCKPAPNSLLSLGRDLEGSDTGDPDPAASLGRLDDAEHHSTAEAGHRPGIPGGDAHRPGTAAPSRRHRRSCCLPLPSRHLEVPLR